MAALEVDWHRWTLRTCAPCRRRHHMHRRRHHHVCKTGRTMLAACYCPRVLTHQHGHQLTVQGCPGPQRFPSGHAGLRTLCKAGKLFTSRSNPHIPQLVSTAQWKLAAHRPSQSVAARPAPVLQVMPEEVRITFGGRLNGARFQSLPRVALRHERGPHSKYRHCLIRMIRPRQPEGLGAPSPLHHPVGSQCGVLRLAARSRSPWWTLHLAKPSREISCQFL
mmetsp:Transcript_25320/g.72201  ORF Transcript_25320/g.72201 Transcript_25320/m.72201 type:complete len:221 (-) Transcript_25320:1024-1686(-)